MAQSNDRRERGGVGLLGLLLVLFIGLKLGHVISWSWWWVLAPFWAPIAVVIVFAAVVIAIVRLFG